MVCYTAKENWNISLIGTDCVTLDKIFVTIFKEPFLCNNNVNLKSCSFDLWGLSEAENMDPLAQCAAPTSVSFHMKQERDFHLSCQALCICPLLRHPPSIPPRAQTVPSKPLPLSLMQLIPWWAERSHGREEVCPLSNPCSLWRVWSWQWWRGDSMQWPLPVSPGSHSDSVQGRHPNS